MKRSEVIETLLSAYHFQQGKRANPKVVTKARTMIKDFKSKEEAQQATQAKRDTQSKIFSGDSCSVKSCGFCIGSECITSPEYEIVKGIKGECLSYFVDVQKFVNPMYSNSRGE